MQAGQLSMMIRKQVSEDSTLSGKGTCALFFTGIAQGSFHSLNMGHCAPLALPLDLLNLVNQYAHLFDVLKKLPPTRSHDHSIPLINEAQPIKI